MLSDVSLLAVSNVNNPVGLVGLPYVMWSAHFFVTHIQTEKISPWNGPTVHVCCFMLARASTKAFVSRIHIRLSSPKNSEENLCQPKNSLAGSLVSRVITVYVTTRMLLFSSQTILMLTHCGRVTQICVFNTVKLGTSASSPQCHSTRRNVSRRITPSSTTAVFGEYFLKISVYKNSQRICYKFLKKHSIKVD